MSGCCSVYGGGNCSYAGRVKDSEIKFQGVTTVVILGLQTFKATLLDGSLLTYF